MTGFRGTLTVTSNGGKLTGRSRSNGNPERGTLNRHHRQRNASVERCGGGGGKVVVECDGLEGALNSSPNVKAFIEVALPRRDGERAEGPGGSFQLA